MKPIIEEIYNLPEPLELFDRIGGQPYSFFLDSACGHEKLGKYSFLGYDPFLVFTSKGDTVTLEWRGGKHEHITADPLTTLKNIYQKYAVLETLEGVPLASGAVGYFSYDLKDFIETLPDLAPDDMGLPDIALGFYDRIVIYDHASGTYRIASSGLPEMCERKNRARAKARLEECKNTLLSTHGRNKKPAMAHPTEVRSNFSKPDYMAAVLKAKEYIRIGDIYQVNLSQRFEAPLTIEPMELYARLRKASPAPFASYLNFKDAIVLSSSPERFILKRGDYIETRPIKGTRPRGQTRLSDLRLEKELLNSAKDRAEHIMIVDLERNDLGRVSRYGSVALTEPVILEKYATVFHLVSTVAGRLRNGVDPIDCLLATFPGGSITGAPKIRSMEIIEELEPVKRSLYTGAIGYLGFDGNMDTSIVIRTFVVKDKKVYFQVGGGIVADSDPEKEYDETLHKAKGLLEALGAEVRKKEAVLV